MYMYALNYYVVSVVVVCVQFSKLFTLNYISKMLLLGFLFLMPLAIQNVVLNTHTLIMYMYMYVLVYIIILLYLLV